MYRLSATDIRSGVTMASPDGQIRVVIGDSNLGTLIEPNPMMAYAGMREGTCYELGDGSKLLILKIYGRPACSSGLRADVRVADVFGRADRI